MPLLEIVLSASSGLETSQESGQQSGQESSQPSSYGFTDHDEDLTFNGLTYRAKSGFTRSAIERGLGVKVSNMDIRGALSSDILDEASIRQGLFDGAEIYIYRVNWREPEQNMLLHYGHLGEIRRSAHGFEAELRGLNHQLTYPKGRLYQSHCDAVLGDRRCLKDLTAHTHQAVIEEARQDSRLLIIQGIENFDAGWFSFGKLKCLDGDNKGHDFDIRHHEKNENKGLIELWQKPFHPIAVHTPIELIVGCDKNFQTCAQKFQNQLNFQGFPHMPGNDYIQYVPRG